MRIPPELNTASYGSDQSGLIWGYQFAPALPARPISTADAALWLARPEGVTGDEFLWLHVNLNAAGTEEWLRRHVNPGDSFFESLHDGSHSTRIEQAEDTLLAISNDVVFDFSFDAQHIATIWISLNSRVFVSARRKPLRSIDRLRESTRHGHIFNTTAELLVQLFHDQADVLVQIVRQTVARVDALEDRMLGGRYQGMRVELGQLRRVLVRLKRLLAPEPAALFRLLNHPPEWMSEDDTDELRQATEEFSVALQDLASLEERIKILQEEVAAQVQEQNNQSLYVLTVITVLALPVNITAGLLGMNVGGVPLAENPTGFWTICSWLVVLTVLIARWAFRRDAK